MDFTPRHPLVHTRNDIAPSSRGGQDDKRLGKYFKMLEMPHVARETVAKQMLRDGADPGLLRLSPDDVSPNSPPGTTLGAARGGNDEPWAPPPPLATRQLAASASAAAAAAAAGSGGPGRPGTPRGKLGKLGSVRFDPAVPWAPGEDVVVATSARDPARAAALLNDLYPLVAR